MDIFQRRIEDYRNKKFDIILDGCQLSELGLNPQYNGLELFMSGIENRTF